MYPVSVPFGTSSASLLSVRSSKPPMAILSTLPSTSLPSRRASLPTNFLVAVSGAYLNRCARKTNILPFASCPLLECMQAACPACFHSVSIFVFAFSSVLVASLTFPLRPRLLHSYLLLHIEAHPRRAREIRCLSPYFASRPHSASRYGKRTGEIRPSVTSATAYPSISTNVS